MDDARPVTPPPADRPVTGPPPRSGSFSDFLNFRAFITPTFITVIWIVGAVFITLAGVVALAGQGGAVNGLVVLVFGNLWWRIVMEIFIVLFRINDSLQAIERTGRRL